MNTPIYKILKAIDNMANLLSENGLILVTFSLGYNENIDTLLEENKLKFTDYLKRISKDNRWKQVQFDEIKNIKYGFPYPHANGIAIGKIKNKKRNHRKGGSSLNADKN